MIWAPEEKKGELDNFQFHFLASASFSDVYASKVVSMQKHRLVN